MRKASNGILFVNNAGTGAVYYMPSDVCKKAIQYIVSFNKSSLDFKKFNDELNELTDEEAVC